LSGEVKDEMREESIQTSVEQTGMILENGKTQFQSPELGTCLAWLVKKK
jgi:hypothetical protein